MGHNHGALMSNLVFTLAQFRSTEKTGTTFMSAKNEGNVLPLTF